MKFSYSSLIRIFCCKLLSVFAALSYAQGVADEVCLQMGVRGLSHCVMGPQLPHGSINPSPQTAEGSHGGYAEGQPVRGFGQLHASGTGWGRYGQILLSPQRGFCPDETGHDSPVADEEARPYRYAATLTRYAIRAEVTPAAHSAVYRFVDVAGTDSEADTAATSEWAETDRALAPDAATAHGGTMTLLLDIAHSIPRDIAVEQRGKFCGGEVRYDAAHQMLVGWGEYIGGFGSLQPYRVYFAIASEDWDLPRYARGATDSPDGHGQLYVRLDPVSADRRETELRIAVSLRSTEKAAEYLRAEVLGRTFADVENAARETWDTTLGAIQIAGATAEERALFYTTLYHAFVMPRDRKDDNPRFEGENIDDHYCVWDTWRTCYPLMTLLNPSFVAKTINSFINRYEHDGECTPSFTSSMEFEMRQGGDDVENVIADAMVKGVQGFDYATAARWVKWSALHNRSHDYQALGWQPETDTLMLCSNALEYAYNDWCAMQTALVVGDSTFAAAMRERSASWQRLFNASLRSGGHRGFIAPRRADGRWEPINPEHVYGSWVEYFYEGNSWTYSHFVPHDFDGLIRRCGGRRAMVSRLHYGLDSGAIALWNEPGFLAPFIFTHCRRPDLTAEYVARLREQNYSLARGYCENEDSGAMGSWYVFTSLGLFPNAGQDFYYLLPPAYPAVTLRMESGAELRIVRTGVPRRGRLPRVYINGERTKAWTVRHDVLKEGAEIRFAY